MTRSLSKRSRCWQAPFADILRLSALLLFPANDKRTWRMRQMLVDPEEHNDWVAEFEVDLGRSRETAEPVLRLVRLASLT